jgi:peptidoglycan/xylan/chitin deacetylase (PgdA/CDA1 family)
MNRFKIGRLKRAVQKIQKRLTKQKALILMYHRIAEVNVDPWGLCVTPQHFSEQLQVLQSKAHPMSLQTLVRAYQEGNLPQRAVALTFDDGYADNLHGAKPLLEQYGIPATIFVTTGYVGREQEFWWDELEQLLLQPGRLPETLSLNINGHSYHWELGASAAYSKEEAQREHTHKAWKSQPGSRLFFYYSIWQQLLPLAESDRLTQLHQIRAWAQTESTARLTHRTLSQEELMELGQSDFVEIGAHTVTHPFLSAQPVNHQQIEIQQSKARLEAIFNRPITSFSYPFGNYASETVALAQKVGFECACSTVEDFVWRGSNRFELPRIAVENWNGEEFAKQLERWFDG